MKSLLAAAILTFSITAQAESAARPMLSHFATCTGTVDGVSIALQFYEELDADTGKPTGKGIATQILADTLQLAGYTTVTNNEATRTIELFAVIEPDVRFAKFDIPKTAESKVEIFAEHFNAVWANLDCRAGGFPF